MTGTQVRTRFEEKRFGERLVEGAKKMRVAELFREFQQRQRALAGRELNRSAFEFLLTALKRDFESATAPLDELELKNLCDSLGTQLDNEYHFAGSDQRRQVIGALLRSIEDIEHKHHFR